MMSDRPKSTVSTNASSTLRLRPTTLLMVSRARATAATLELGLAEVNRLSEDAVRRLTRLGAARAWRGDPHPDDQANPDPMARMRAAAAAQIRPPGNKPAERPGINRTVAAVWTIAGMSVEETLDLVDRLRFDASADSPAAPPEKPDEWADPMKQVQQMMAKAALPPPDDLTPKFLYLIRPTEEQLARVTAEAYELARRRAERLATAAQRRLGGISSLIYTNQGTDGHGRPDRMMEVQRATALLAVAEYAPAEGEVASEDPRSAEVTVSVHAAYHLEE